jgi:hypothetical protein
MYIMATGTIPDYILLWIVQLPSVLYDILENVTLATPPQYSPTLARSPACKRNDADGCNVIVRTVYCTVLYCSINKTREMRQGTRYRRPASFSRKMDGVHISRLMFQVDTWESFSKAGVVFLEERKRHLFVFVKGQLKTSSIGVGIM